MCICVYIYIYIYIIHWHYVFWHRDIGIIIHIFNFLNFWIGIEKRWLIEPLFLNYSIYSVYYFPTISWRALSNYLLESSNKAILYRTINSGVFTRIGISDFRFPRISDFRFRISDFGFPDFRYFYCETYRYIDLSLLLFPLTIFTSLVISII